MNTYLDPIFRWVHILAGILWIGMLYFFNFVNSAFAPTMDAETKKKVVPQLMPRALFWFRMGAALTWITGILLLGIVFYMGRIVFDSPDATWGLPAILMVLTVFVAPFIYDALMSGLGKSNLKAAILIGLLLTTAYTYLMTHWAHFSYRGMMIHVGGMFGTIMAFNVWYRIWPAQQKIITATRDGQAPDAALVAMAGMRSRQNTYMSLPLLFTMINSHHVTWNSSYAWLMMIAVILIAWWTGTMLFKRASKVQGF
jgi:uncharacterized membrane protein